MDSPDSRAVLDQSEISGGLVEMHTVVYDHESDLTNGTVCFGAPFSIPWKLASHFV